MTDGTIELEQNGETITMIICGGITVELSVQAAIILAAQLIHLARTA